VTLFIYRGDRHELEKGTVTHLIVAKQRNGPLGEVRLTFNNTFARFDAAAHEYHQAASA
jgi:replicative DNA helicase